MSRLDSIRDARRVLILSSCLILTDTMFFNAVTPLLPHYAKTYHLSSAGAGLLSGMYPFGTMIFALPSGLITSRLGVKTTVLLGLAGLAITSVLFGFATQLYVLDASRVLQGASGSCIWTGSLTWLVSEVPTERRGEFIGAALGAAIGGSLLGPVLGGLASIVGTGPAFSVVAAVAVVLAAVVCIKKAAPAPRLQSLGLLVASLGDANIRLGAWFVLFPALASGTLFVLVPLRLSRLGLGGFGIGMTFLFAAAIGGLVSPLIGRLSDRRGRAVPLAAGLTGAVILFSVWPWPNRSWEVIALLICTMTAVSFFFTPGFSLLTDASDTFGLDYALAFALMSLAWAPGQAIGSALSGTVASAGGDSIPYLGVAAIALLSLLVVRRRLPPVVAHLKSSA